MATPTSRDEDEIRGLLDRAFHFTYGDGADPRTGGALATEAVGRGLLALIPLVREIGDQIDTKPRHPGQRPGDFPLFDAARLLEARAIGDEGSAREETIARLVMHHRFTHKHAAEIARHAMAQARRQGAGHVEDVEHACKILGIEDLS